MDRAPAAARVTGAVAAVALGIAIAGCGSAGGDHGARSATAADRVATRRSQAIRSCLASRGFAVNVGRVAHPSAHEPNGELVARRRSDLAFVALYDDLARARRLEPRLRANARRFGGRLERLGRVTVVWTRPPSAAAERDARACVAG